MTSIILAGGKSSRLGQNKALQTIGGKSLIQWIIDSLAALSTEIIIATARGEPIPCFSTVRTRTVADIYPEKGPLGGIYSGLMASSSTLAIVAGCDTPFLSAGLLDHMVRASPKFDIVVPRLEGKLEPLCAVYSKSCLAPIQSLLEQDERRIYDFYGMVKVKYIAEDEINRFDPDHLSFFNINNQDDLETARNLAMEKGWVS
jgi:molybdopterin-guanine dinucleotide biosynthesis protein A